MNIIGIIGGFGPEATAHLYLRLTDKTRQHILVRHVRVPRRLEHDAIVLGKNLDRFEPLLVRAAQDLERQGATCILLPCNTLHVHEQAIRSATRIPFISIIKESGKHLNDRRIKTIGLIGSRLTVKNNLFQNELPGTKFVTVPPALQNTTDRALDTFVATKKESSLRAALMDSFAFFEKRHVSDVLAACTDFHGLCPSSLRVHDTIDILVEATVNML